MSEWKLFYILYSIVVNPWQRMKAVSLTDVFAKEWCDTSDSGNFL